MTPEQWAQLTPQQQAAHTAQYGPPPPAFISAVGYTFAAPAPATAKRTNVWAIVSVCCGAVGLLLVPVLFSTAGVISGIVGYQMAYHHQEEMGGQRLSALGILLGLFGGLFLLGRAGVL